MADVDEKEYNGCPGEVVAVDKQSFTLKTGKGALIVRELQLEGKKRMDAGAFMRGYAIECGMKFGE